MKNQVYLKILISFWNDEKNMLLWDQVEDEKVHW
jgi:hypothetical protein